jgi:hypothetical protein
MMEKAGYLQRTGYKASDCEGNMHEIIELHVLSIRYAIRRADLANAISGRVFVQVEELTHNWNYYLGATSGLGQVSVSGKALNIDIFNGGSFTVSLRALGNVMYGKERLPSSENTGGSALQKMKKSPDQNVYPQLYEVLTRSRIEHIARINSPATDDRS